MALKKSYEISIYGKQINFEDCYIKINYMRGGKSNIVTEVVIFDEAKENVIANRTYNFVPSVEDSASNFIKQGYEYLKTLEEYADAIDILEDEQ